MNASERSATQAALFALGRMVDNFVFEIYRSCRYDTRVAARKLGLEVDTVARVAEDRRIEAGYTGVTRE